MKYEERAGSLHTDGTPIFQQQQDRDGERLVVERLKSAWGCEIEPFGMLAPIDYFATRHGRLSAVLEIKCRSHAQHTYETVFLNVRKWLALGLAQVGMGVPAIFVVKFTDAIGYIRWEDIPGNRLSILGCSRRVKSRSDIEPIIEVRVGEMVWLSDRRAARDCDD